MHSRHSNYFLNNQHYFDYLRTWTSYKFNLAMFGSLLGSSYLGCFEHCVKFQKMAVEETKCSAIEDSSSLIIVAVLTLLILKISSIKYLNYPTVM